MAPPLKKNENGEWVVGFGTGRHKDSPLEKVAQTDPLYLNFIWTRSLARMTDESINVLDDVMEKYQIPRDAKSAREVRAKQRATRRNGPSLK